MPDLSSVSRLRATLGGLDCGSYRRRPILPLGIEAIDTRLTAGGLRLDALHEIAGAGAGLADECAATLFAAGIAARCWGPVLWVVRRGDLFAPDVARSGLAAGRIVVAEAHDDAELVALIEAGLRHRGLGAVIGEARRAALPATRRLQAAAEGGRTIALLLRRHGRRGADPFARPSAAVTRWRVGDVAGVDRWRVALTQPEGEPGAWTLRACDATGRCTLVRTRRAPAEAGVVTQLRPAPATEPDEPAVRYG